MGDKGEETATELRLHRQKLIESGEEIPTTGPAHTSAALQDSGPWAEDLRGSALIIDTDIGGDADDAIAVAAAARCAPELALVITADETAGVHGPGQRARFARHLLDTIGRSDVPVAAGASLGNTRYYCVDGLVPDTVPLQSADLIAAVRAVAATHPGPIRWVGMGPLTNLAHLIDQAPELVSRLRVTQMGGALRYRDPEAAEHNFRLDVAAVHSVFAGIADGRLAPPEFVTSEITFVPDTEISAAHPLYRALDAQGAPAWAALLAAHMGRWFTHFYPATKQHDALALSAALELPFVDSDHMPLAVDEVGRTTVAEEGTPVRVSTFAHYPGFMSWLHDRLDPSLEPTKNLEGFAPHV